MSFKSLRGLIPIFVLLGIWQLVGNTQSATTPAPSAWWPAFKQIEASGQLWIALRTTMELYVEGLVIAAILGVAVGIVLGSSRHVARAMSPLLEFLRATPAAAIVPGFILLFHASKDTEIFIVVFGTIWPILLNTTSARAALSPLRLDVGHTMGLSLWERLFKLVIPSLLPAIFVGIRLAATLCLIVTLLVDFLVATGGLGYLLVEYEQEFNGSDAFALLAVIAIVAILINLIIGAAERLVLRRFPTAQ